MDKIEPPDMNEFFIRGYRLNDAIAICQHWDELTPVERGRYIFPLPLPKPIRCQDALD